MKCRFCFRKEVSAAGKCDCSLAKDGMARIEAAIEAMTKIGTGERKMFEPWTPERHDRLESMRTGIILSGGRVKPRE